MASTGRTPTLVVLTGIPGAGKSESAKPIAAFLKATLLTKDQIEAAMWKAGLDKSLTGSAAYEVMTAVASEQLRHGRSVVLDSVATTASIRERWRDLATEAQADCKVVECICSDIDLHKRRIDQRTRGIPGWPELCWSDVEHVRASYEPWSDRRLTIDSAKDLSANLALVFNYVAQARPHER